MDITLLSKELSKREVEFYSSPTDHIVFDPVISLVIPTLNEEQNLPLILPLIPTNLVDEVILVDGRSTDDTVKVAKMIMPTIKVVYEKTPGKGAAMLAGYNASKGDIIIVMDADGSHDPREIPRFIKPLMEGADMVKGSRFAPGGGTTDMPRLRKLGNGLFVVLSNSLFSTRFTDLCYGFHAFWRHCLNDLDLENTKGFEIDTALYLQAQHKKLRVVEVPSFEGYRFHGIGKLKTFPDGYRVLKTIMREWLISTHKESSSPFIGYRGADPSFNALMDVRSLPRDTDNSLLDLQLIRLFFRMLLQEFPMEKAMEYILKYSQDTLNAGSGSMLCIDDKGNLTNAILSYNGMIKSENHDMIKDVINCGLAGWVIENQKSTLIQNTLEDPRWIPREWEITNDIEYRSVMAIPVLLAGKLSAVLTLARKASNFTQEEMNLVSNFVPVL